MSTNTTDTLARSFEDAALAFARFGVAITTHHWQRDLHVQAKAWDEGYDECDGNDGPNPYLSEPTA